MLNVNIGYSTGYPIAVTTRWELITTLFNRFPQKDKVLTNHLVTNVEYSSKGVSIHCQNGACFKGDIVVGADGVHSIIRAEMWRNAATASPDAFCVEDKTCKYQSKSIFLLLTRTYIAQPNSVSSRVQAGVWRF